MLKEEKKQILTTHNTYIKMHTVQQTKYQLRHDVNGNLVFDLQ